MELIITSPETYGAELHINDSDFNYYSYGDTLVIDIETDEKDNFVGLGFTKDGKRIDYISYGLTTEPGVIRTLLETGKLIGHNGKFDIKQLIGWGVNIKPEQYFGDTCLMSYVQNTTKDTHSLKDLAKEYLGLEWPKYKDIVGTGKKKVTLDKQPVELVARYNGMDVLATYRLHEFLQKKLTVQQKRYLETIELPTARVLLEMELKGVRVDVEYLKELDQQFDLQLADLNLKIRDHWTDKEFLNINSNLQIAKLLQSQGAELPKTAKGNLKVDKQTLEQWKHLPVVPLLLEYSKIEKLKSTYTEALLEKQKDGRIFASFNQIARNAQGTSVGISTGRLSSSNPNLQNVPARTEEGKLIRKAFISGPDEVFIDADFSQIEPRLVAHFSKDPLFLAAFNEERDIYQDLVEGTGRSRNDGKTFMLALLYGAQPKKLASVFKCSENDAEGIVKKIMSKLPGVTAWINRTKYEAHQKKGVMTLFKRWVPLPLINSDDRYERMHWERVAVNTVIQGSAAEIMKLGLIKLKEAGYVPNLTVHDEFLITFAPGNWDGHLDIDYAKSDVRSILETIVKLDVPLKVEIGIGKDWNEAKS